jgi:hypothetical protein
VIRRSDIIDEFPFLVIRKFDNDVDIPPDGRSFSIFGRNILIVALSSENRVVGLWVPGAEDLMGMIPDLPRASAVNVGLLRFIRSLTGGM